MIKLYDDLRTDSCCKNMDRFLDDLYGSIKVLSHIIALNKFLNTYTEEYIQELTKQLEALKKVYGNICSITDLEEMLESEQ